VVFSKGYFTIDTLIPKERKRRMRRQKLPSTFEQNTEEKLTRWLDEFHIACI